MARTGAKEDGAAWRTVPSAYGDPKLRAEWVAKADALTDLPSALAALQAYRKANENDGLRDADALWIEARLEERVAVLRFSAMTNEEIRTKTLLGDNTAEVCAGYLARAKAASKDKVELEKITKEFRDTYRPPIMMSSPFMRTESELAEILMKERSLNWFDMSIPDLREERGVVVVKAGS